VLGKYKMLIKSVDYPARRVSITKSRGYIYELRDRSETRCEVVVVTLVLPTSTDGTYGFCQKKKDGTYGSPTFGSCRFKVFFSVLSSCRVLLQQA
jgi:hypothetical protein